jgi:hypothetical protein
VIENAKTAHKAGMVWVALTINGGPVKLEENDKGSIGRLEIKGAFTAKEALAIWRAATGGAEAGAAATTTQKGS